MNPLREPACIKTERPEPISLTGIPGLNNQPGLGPRGDFDAECAELLHGLNNALVGMLLNTQVLEWKLPSYSRLKRNLHEIERNAQRGGELVKRLLKRLSIPPQEQLTDGQYRGELTALEEAPSAHRELSGEVPTGTDSFEPRTLGNPSYARHRKKVPHTPV